jgi:hypothetical protein
MNATLLCVALLVPEYGEKDILKGIRDAGGLVGVALDSGTAVRMPESTTDADLGELCEVRGLTFLSLIATNVTDKGLRTVTGLRGLSRLDLRGTVVTDEGLRHLQAMRNLDTVDLRKCPNITDEGIARLQKALPKCRIRH